LARKAVNIGGPSVSRRPNRGQLAAEQAVVEGVPQAAGVAHVAELAKAVVAEGQAVRLGLGPAGGFLLEGVLGGAGRGVVIGAAVEVGVGIRGAGAAADAGGGRAGRRDRAAIGVVPFVAEVAKTAGAAVVGEQRLGIDAAGSGRTQLDNE